MLRWLKHGDMLDSAKRPEWYSKLKASQYLGIPIVPAASMEDVPVIWIERALMADRCEANANEHKEALRMRAQLGAMF